MKKESIILGFIFLFLTFLSCNKEQRDFTDAKQANTIEALKEFATNYPGGEYIDSAKGLIDKMVWQSFKSKNDISEIESFIEDYPGSSYLDSAKLMIEKQNSASDTLNASKDTE